MNAVASVAILFSIAVFMFNECTWGLQVIPERASLVSINDKYVVDGKVFVKRYGRRSKYYINIEGNIKHVWANNISLHLIFYEYLHNEYKRSFVEMHFKLCDMINNDPYVGKSLAATGITCPLAAGLKIAHNMSVPADDFPNVWPFEKCKVDMKVHQLPTNDLIFHAELYLLFKQKSGN